MISISKAVSELERFEELKRMLVKYYPLAIRSVAEYAVDVEPRHTAEFRAHLQMMEAQAAFAVSEEEYAAIQSSFRGELRSYHDFTVSHIARMRAEMTAAAEAMRSLAGGVAISATELKAKMREQIVRLESAAASDDITEIRKGIRTAALGVAEVCEQLALSSQLAIAQLQDELRTLHLEMSQERRSIYIDPSSGAWIRQKLDERVERLLREGQSFSILFVWAGLRRLKNPHSKHCVEGVRKALVKRMEETVKHDALVARWSEEMFAAVIETEPAACKQICEEVAKKLADPFSVQEDGIALTIHVEIRMAVVERLAAAEEAGFFLELDEVTRALAERPLVHI